MAKKLFNETAEFKKLNATWNKKLKDSGFVDIEEGVDSPVVKPQKFRLQKSQHDSGNSYYELCQSILTAFRFRKDIHRQIFTLHSQGMSERDISNWVKENTGGTFSQKGINLLINRIKESYLKGE